MEAFLFYKFFLQLRKVAGIELDQRQYADFLECFVVCKPSNKIELLRLCKALWLSRSSHRAQFEELFDQEFASLKLAFDNVWKEKDSNNERETEDKMLDGNRNEQEKAKWPEELAENDQGLGISENRENKTRELGNEVDLPSDKWKEVMLNVQEETQTTNLKNVPTDHVSTKSVEFVFSDSKHLPFNKRKVQQAWRRFSSRKVLKFTEEPDIVASIRQLSKMGALTELVYCSEKSDNQKVVWLSDHGGDMTPFEEWDNTLYDIVKDNVGYSSINRYYFHHYPVMNEVIGRSQNEFVIFKDRGHTVFKSLNYLSQRWEKGGWLIIFSEAGAIRHRIDINQINAFYKLGKFIGGKAKILLLNPVSEWAGSSAGYLSLMLPMYNLTDASILKAAYDL